MYFWSHLLAALTAHAVWLMITRFIGYINRKRR